MGIEPDLGVQARPRGQGAPAYTHPGSWCRGQEQKKGTARMCPGPQEGKGAARVHPAAGTHPVVSGRAMWSWGGGRQGGASSGCKGDKRVGRGDQV